MLMSDRIILIHNPRLFSSDLLNYLRVHHPGMTVLETAQELMEALKDFSGVIILNSFPEQFHQVLEMSDAAKVSVICSVPLGERETYRNGLRFVNGIFRISDHGDPELYIEGPENQTEKSLAGIFKKCRITTVDREDLDLMAAELILRPMIVSLISGRLMIEGERSLLSDSLKAMAISTYSIEIALARDALRYNRFSSDSFSDIERKIREVWNDLSNY